MLVADLALTCVRVAGSRERAGPDVQQAVVSGILAHHEIAWRVVQPITVDMVHDRRLRERMAHCTPRNDAMLEHPATATIRDHAIAISVDHRRRNPGMVPDEEAIERPLYATASTVRELDSGRRCSTTAAAEWRRVRQVVAHSAPPAAITASFARSFAASKRAHAMIRSHSAPFLLASSARKDSSLPAASAALVAE
jgi:hypothetical protein